MSYLIVPDLESEEDRWPTLGGSVCDFLEKRSIYGPGDLAGQDYELSDEKAALLHRSYEVYPRGHKLAGRRRFKRVCWSVRKGLAKTELQAQVCYVELHPEGPVRFDHWAEKGEVSEWGYEYEVDEPVGRPVSSPYIPMLAYNKDQVEELAYGVLTYICSEGPDADMFDVSLERIIRLSARGTDDGKAVPLAQSPNARDGARTTFQAFDEPHRMYLPRLLEAHQTMNNNLPKRPVADAWSFYVGTAGQLGQKSIAESLYHEAEGMREQPGKDPRFFFFHRDSGPTHKGDKDASGHNLLTKRGRMAAIKEATGPDGEYGPGQFEDIAELYDRPDTDRAYWERVQLNLWLQSDRQAFDINRLVTVEKSIPKNALVVAGFDGARFRDSTGIVIADLLTGVHQLFALWERPPTPEGVDPTDDEWEVNPLEVSAAVTQMMRTYRVQRFNADPPHWLESVATWAGEHPDVVEEWPTHRTTAMAYAIRNYRQGLREGTIKFAVDDRPLKGSHIPDETMGEALRRHIGNAGRHDVNLWDDDGKQLFVLDKIQPERKFDACMADVLANEARLDVLASKQFSKMTKRSGSFGRLR